jgi:hypothetical protein
MNTMMRLASILIATSVLATVANCSSAPPPPEAETIQITGAGAIEAQSMRVPPSRIPLATAEPDPDGATLLGVGMAGDGAYVAVSYRAPVALARTWIQDSVYVVDEKTQLVYKDIPIMPVIGPLIGRPGQDGQPGYVMLQNYYQVLRAGSVVTVVLGNYRREHVTVGAK